MISIVLAYGVVIETSVDRSLRVFCHDKFAVSAKCCDEIQAAMNGRGSSTAILHKQARLLHKEDMVFCKFCKSS